MKKFIGAIVSVAIIFGALAGCGQAATDQQAAASPDQAGQAPATGGLVFGYVVNDMSHEWYQNIVIGARARAEELGIELRVADAAMDVARQVNQLETYINEGVDALLITPVDVAALASVMAQAEEAGIPVITESNVVPGAVTYVGINNTEGGRMAGEWFAQYALENNIDPRILIVGLPAFEDCRQRVQGFKEGMDAAGLDYTIVQEVDGQGSKETSLMVSQDAFTANPDINVIFGINDNSTTGAMAAFTEAGLDESTLTAIGFGFEGNVGREALLDGGPYKAAVAMFPDYMGVSLINASYKVVNGEAVPENYESGTVVITQDNFSEFYSLEDGVYVTNFRAIDALMD